MQQPITGKTVPHICQGVYALCGINQQQLHADVLKNDVFIFVHRKLKQIKLLTWKGDGPPFITNGWKKGCTNFLRSRPTMHRQPLMPYNFN
jgi:hypothetical protein